MNASSNKSILKGRWNNIDIRSRKKITAKYDKIKECIEERGSIP